ncbi:MAG: hypothetical protein ACFN1A_02535 [Corynebacterium matruchotii]
MNDIPLFHAPHYAAATPPEYFSGLWKTSPATWDFVSITATPGLWKTIRTQ